MLILEIALGVALGIVLATIAVRHLSIIAAAMRWAIAFGAIVVLAGLIYLVFESGWIHRASEGLTASLVVIAAMAVGVGLFVAIGSAISRLIERRTGVKFSAVESLGSLIAVSACLSYGAFLVISSPEVGLLTLAIAFSVCLLPIAVLRYEFVRRKRSQATGQ